MKTMYGYLFVVAALFVVSNATDYCNVKSCVDYGMQHTMCAYSDPTPAAECGPREHHIIGLRAKQIQRIVAVHNNMRARVAAGKELRGSPGPQPPASNMGPLKWDPELAVIAQRWANQCSISHDQCRDVDKYFVGQNMGYKSSSGNNTYKAVDIIREWYNEVQDFDASLVPSVTDYGSSGHYTQIVTAETKTVGCGQIRYKEADGWNALYLVCNYGPAGNGENAELYKIRT